MIRKKATIRVYEFVLQMSERSEWRFPGPFDPNEGVEHEGQSNDGDEQELRWFFDANNRLERIVRNS